MDANMQELEKKIGIKIEAVRDTMLDRLSSLDQKLIIIGVLLKNIIDAQNKIYNPPEKRSNMTEKNTPSKIQDQRNMKAESGGVNGPLHESGPNKPLQADGQIWGQRSGLHIGGPSRQGPLRESASSYGWLSLYSPPEPDSDTGSSGKRFVKTGQDDIFKKYFKCDQQGTKESWTGLSADKTDKVEEELQTRVSIVWGKIKDDKTDILQQDDSFKKVNKSDQLGTLNNRACSSTDKTDKVKEELQTRELAFWGKIKDEKTDFFIQDSSKSDQWANKDSGSLGKAIENEINCKRIAVGSDIGIDCKEVGWGPKRKHPDSPVSGPNDGPTSGRSFTRSKRRLDMFALDEQEIFNDIDGVMKSIRRIMHQKGYNDCDLLSADDQTYILENVSEKNQKMDAGVNDIMICKNMKFHGGRCFYILLKDGRTEVLSYHKCLKNLLIRKYPNKVDELFTKYIKKYKSQRLENMDFRGSGPVQTRTPRS